MTKNNFNETVRLEVETAGVQNMLVKSTNTVGEDIFLPTVTNGEFATNTTGWTAGTGWTLTRVAGPPTRGRLTKSASVAAGELLVQNTQNFAANPGELWSMEVSLTRVSTSPASANMQLRLNLVAYNASNTRLGVVAGYNGTNQTDVDAVLAPGDQNIEFTFDPNYSAVTPAGTTYLRFEIVAHNAWTYAGTAFTLDVRGFFPGRLYDRSSTGWTATNISMREETGQWLAIRTGESNPTLEADKVAVVAGKPIAVASNISSYNTSGVTVVPYNAQIGVRYYNASNVFLSESLSTAAPGCSAQTVTDSLGNTFQQPVFVRLSHSDVVPVGAAKASLVIKTDTGVFYAPISWNNCVMIQGTDAEIADTSYAASLPSNSNNRIMNPSGEMGVQGWQDYDSNSVLTTRNNLPPNAKSYDFRFGGLWDQEEPSGKEIIVAQVTGGYNALYSNTTEVTAGQWVGGSVLAKGRGYFPPTGSYIISYVSVGWQFRNSSDAVISTSLSTSVLVQNDYYAYIKAPVMQAPAGTVRARMVVQNSGDRVSITPSNPGAWMMIKQAQMNVGASSASVTDQPFAYSEHWKDVLGGTHEIGVSRNELDTGVLTAEILDPTLDPAEFDTLVPGLKVRLRSLVDDVWTTTFFGSITNAKTTYDVNRSTGALKPRIVIEAADTGKVLATTPSPNTVATIDGLANNMPTDIQWNINGKTAVGVNPTVVAVNAQASTMDQVMITRDTVGGYAWVDRFGVFNAWDAFNLQRKTIWFSDQARPTATDRNENIVVNPTFALGTSNWTGAGGTLTWDSTNKAAKLTTTGGVAGYIYVADVAVHEGDFIQGQIDASVTAGKGWQGHFIFYNSAHTELSRIHSDSSGYLGGFVPAGAVFMRLAIDAYSAPGGGTPTAGIVLTVNSVVVVVGNDYWPGDYFDGDSEYSTWTGAAHASTSIRDYSLYQDYLTNIDIGYNTSEVINIVNLKVPTRNAEGSYDDVSYGPYQDTTSIADWGPQAVEMTIAGGVTPSTVATRILNSNADPKRTVNSITFVVDDDDSFKKAATVDLYDLVWIRLTGKMDEVHRVAGIQHSIQAVVKDGRAKHVWTVTLFFKAVDTAAQVTGGAPSSASTNDVGAVFARAHINANITGIPNNAYTNITGWTTDELSGISYSSGVFTIAKSGLYLVTARLQYSVASGYRVGVKLNRNNSGNGPTNLAPSGAATSVQITELMRFSAGETLRFMTYHDYTTTVTLGGDSIGTWSDMSMRWVGE